MKVQGHIIVRRKPKNGDNGQDAILYELMPSDQVVVLSNTGVFSPSYLTCSVKKIQGSTLTMLTSSSALSAEGLILRYGMDDGGDGEVNITPTTKVYPKSIMTFLEFVLYKNGKVIDRKKIRVCNDGSDGGIGDTGLQGCILRQSEWVAGVEYRNDEALTSGTRYLDIAIVTTGAKTFNAYKCLKTHTSSTSIPVTNTTYWQKFNSLQPVYTPLIMAQNAILRFMQGNQLLIMKSDNTTVAAGLVGGDYPLWVGATTPSSAPFKVSITGIMTAEGAIVKNSILQNVKITGTVRQPWSRSGIYISVGGSNEKMSFDNIAAGASGGWGDGSINSMITWTLADSGRIMRIANWKFDGETFTGTVDVTAPSGKYFFEDGIQKTKLSLSREVIELMGYGDSSNFYGWIVLNRVDFMTTKRYGSCRKALFSGVVSDGSMIQQKTFDGSKLTSSKIGTGYYQVTFPYDLPHSEYAVHLTGYTCVRGNNIIYASVSTQNSQYFTVYTGDDSSPNDGGFTYEVISTADWT